MSKKKTYQSSSALSHLGEWTNWDYNAEYEYSEGICFTNQGMISLYRQEDAAQATIIHNSRIYHFWIHEPVTKLGLVRMAKKWAKKIQAGKQ